MRIAIVSSARSPETVELVNALAQRGHRLALYSMPEHKNVRKNLDARVEMIPLPYGGITGYFRNARPLESLIQTFQPDVVNAHYAGGYGTLARRSHVRPLILSVWGGDVSGCKYGYPLYKKLVRRNLSAADAVSCTDSGLVDVLRNDLLYDGALEVTSFGVDCCRYAPRNQTVRPSGQARIGTVCSLEKKRDLELLLRSFALLDRKLNRAIDATLFIYGSGKRQEIQSLVEKMELGSKVKLMGGVKPSELPAVWNRLDLACILPVRRPETADMAALGAMACGVPVITVGKRAAGSVVVDGVTGIVVKKDDPEAVAEKMYEVVWDRVLYQKYKAACRKCVLQWYDLEQSVRQLELLYGRTINEAKEEAR